MLVRFWGMMAGSGFPAHWSKIRSQNVPAISTCMGKIPNMIYCYQDPACITERPVRRFTSWMWKRMNIASLILLIFTTLPALLTKWIISIFFSVQWLLETSSTLKKTDFNTVYASIKGTTKHVGCSFTEAEYMAPVLDMLHQVAGSEEKWRARPFVSNSNCFVVPPLRFASESCLVMEEAVRNGMPVLLLSAGQAGATAPASIAGAVAQALSEVIAGLIYVNAMQAGHPCICGTWPFVSDLRTGAMSGGSGEQGLLTAACAKMLQFYDLPGGAAAGMADSKMPDAQSDNEKGSTLVMAGLSWLNMVDEAAGMHASLLGFCLDSLIIDNDMLGQCLRCVRGIEVNESTLGVQVMKDVCMGGPCHYLEHDQTSNLMQTEYIYPEIADRSSPKEWEELGKPNLLDDARKRKEEILHNYHPNHISKELDAKLRSQFKILL
jgi:trimethylamine--corrinoid protein Co-methyltransferase